MSFDYNYVKAIVSHFGKYNSKTLDFGEVSFSYLSVKYEATANNYLA